VHPATATGGHPAPSRPARRRELVALKYRHKSTT
jgi:hypothetical protein